jgi:methionyl-tRNA synthetase
MIGIEDFAKVDLRIAEIIDCKPIKRAKKLLELTLNDGTSAPRTVVSGIARWYSPENLVGRKIILVYNLSPATLCGVVSSGMILAAACGEDDVRVIFADDMPSGAKIS